MPSTPTYPAALEPGAGAEALIFDCDGTLVDSLAANEAAWRSAFADFGVTMESAWYRDRVSMSAPVLIAAMSQRERRELDANQLRRRATELFLARADLVVGWRPVVALARAFHSRVPLAVASGGGGVVVAASLRAAGIAELFEAVISFDDVTRGKPAPDVYLTAAARLGIDPERCVAYDDTDAGLTAARAAGMRAVDVRPTLHEVSTIPPQRD